MDIKDIRKIVRPAILPTTIEDENGEILIKAIKEYTSDIALRVNQLIELLDVEEEIVEPDNPLLADIVFSLPDPSTPVWRVTVTQPANGYITVNGEVGTTFTFAAGTQVTVQAFGNTNYTVAGLFEEVR